ARPGAAADDGGGTLRHDGLLRPLRREGAPRADAEPGSLLAPDDLPPEPRRQPGAHDGVRLQVRRSAVHGGHDEGDAAQPGSLREEAGRLQHRPGSGWRTAARGRLSRRRDRRRRDRPWWADQRDAQRTRNKRNRHVRLRGRADDEQREPRGVPRRTAVMAGLFGNLRKKKDALAEAAAMADEPIGRASAAKAAKAAKPRGPRVTQDDLDII